MSNILSLGNHLPYKAFQEEWKKIFGNMSKQEIDEHMRKYKLIRLDNFQYPEDSFINIRYDEYTKDKEIFNYESEEIQHCICGVKIKYRYYITDIKEKTGYVFIIGSKCMKNWNISKLPICAFCEIDIKPKSKSDVYCNECFTSKCILCKGYIDKSNIYYNKYDFEREQPIIRDLHGNLCGECKSNKFKVCRKCGTHDIGCNRNTKKVYFYCIPCRNQNKQNYELWRLKQNMLGV